MIFEKLIIKNRVDKANWFYVKYQKTFLQASNKHRLRTLFTYICEFSQLETIKFLYKIIIPKKVWYHEIMYLETANENIRLSPYDEYSFMDAILARSEMNNNNEVYKWIHKKLK